jgi:hypothetical protein
MNFIITEDESNRLDSVRGQLNLVAELFAGTPRAGALHIDPVDTSEFLFTQVATIKSIIEATESRHSESWEQSVAEEPSDGNLLPGMDMLDIIRLLSGQASLTKGRVKELGRRVLTLTQRDASVMDVLSASSLEFELSPRAGDDVFVCFAPMAPAEMPKAAAGKKSPRKRERLSATAGEQS